MAWSSETVHRSSKKRLHSSTVCSVSMASYISSRLGFLFCLFIAHLAI